MVELIINETGFPKSRPALKEFQDSFLVPINEILRTLPGNRILSGFVFSSDGLNSTSTEGIILFRGKLWTVEPSAGPVQFDPRISFFEEIETMQFNVGTQGSPIYEYRPGKIIRTAKVGEHAGRSHLALYSSFIRGRKMLEYLKAGSIFCGPQIRSTHTLTYHVSFGTPIQTKDYQVLGNFRAANPQLNFIRVFSWDINNRTRSGFDVMVTSGTADSTPLIFDYTVIPINRTISLDQPIP